MPGRGTVLQATCSGCEAATGNHPPSSHLITYHTLPPIQRDNAGSLPSGIFRVTSETAFPNPQPGGAISAFMLAKPPICRLPANSARGAQHRLRICVSTVNNPENGRVTTASPSEVQLAPVLRRGIFSGKRTARCEKLGRVRSYASDYLSSKSEALSRH